MHALTTSESAVAEENKTAISNTQQVTERAELRSQLTYNRSVEMSLSGSDNQSHNNQEKFTKNNCIQIALVEKKHTRTKSRPKAIGPSSSVITAHMCTVCSSLGTSVVHNTIYSTS